MRPGPCNCFTLDSQRSRLQRYLVQGRTGPLRPSAGRGCRCKFASNTQPAEPEPNRITVSPRVNVLDLARAQQEMISSLSLKMHARTRFLISASFEFGGSIQILTRISRHGSFGLPSSTKTLLEAPMDRWAQNRHKPRHVNKQDGRRSGSELLIRCSPELVRRFTRNGERYDD